MKNILCFGDSNTWGNDAYTYDPETDSGKRMPFETRWPGALQFLLGNDYRIIEDALNGRTTVIDDPFFPGRRGIDSLKIALDAHAPLDLVILALGCNELKSMFNLSAGMITYGMELLVNEAQKSYYGYPVPKVMIIAPSPVPDEISNALFGANFGKSSGPVSRELGPLYRELAERKHCLFLDCGKLHLELNEIDMLHYSANDHQKIAHALEPIIRTYFEF